MDHLPAVWAGVFDVAYITAVIPLRWYPSGMHYPESRYYLRRVRISADADVLGPLREAGYRCVGFYNPLQHMAPSCCEGSPV